MTQRANLPLFAFVIALATGPAHAGLVSSYNMDGNLLDPISGNDGTYFGGAETYVDGYDGTPSGAVSFDGGSYVLLSPIAGLPLRAGPAMSVAMWVKGAPQSDRRVFSESNTLGNGTPLYNIGTDNVGATGAVDLFFRNTGGTPVGHVKVGNAFDDTWHHIVVTDDNGNVRVFVDGVVVGTLSYTRGDMPVDATTLGGIFRDTPCCLFTGAIDEVRLYDHALSVAEVWGLVDPPGLVSRLRLDGDLIDEISGNDGTFLGGAETYVDGFDGTPGGAISFDGVDDYVSLAQNSGLPLTTSTDAFTVAMWVNGPVQRDRRVFSEGSDASDTPLYNIGTHNTGANGALDIFIRDSGGTPVSHYKTDRAAFDDTWHHIAVVDDNDSLTLYIDGVREGTAPSYNGVVDPLSSTTLGGIFRSASCCHFAGAIDDVWLFNRALSSDEVEALVPERDGCPADGDTTCGGLTVAGPDGGEGPGEWTLTADGAADDGGDPIWYIFTGTSSLGESFYVGPQQNNVAMVQLLEGAWDIEVSVDDEFRCRDAAEGSTCTGTALVILEPPRKLVQLDLNGDLADATGNGNDGSFVGEESVPYIQGHDCADPGAVSFDGVDDYIQLANNDGVPVSNSARFSVAMWVKGLPVAGVTDRRVYSEGSTTNNAPLFNIGTDSANPPTGVVDIFIRNDANAQLVPHIKSTGVAFDGTWHHITWVDDNGNATLYIDGVADATDFTYNRGQLTLDTATVGGILRATPSHWFPGEIDDFMLFNYALSAEEVAAMVGPLPNCGPPQLAGDCNQDGTRNITDVVSYVIALFPGFSLLGSGAGLPCETELGADGNQSVLNINSDEVTDISDLIYLANFLFLGGPPPVQGEGCVSSAGECEANPGC